MKGARAPLVYLVVEDETCLSPNTKLRDVAISHLTMAEGLVEARGRPLRHPQ